MGERKVKLITKQAGYELFQEALKKAFEGELVKQAKEHHVNRKKFDFRSKVFKQTYKFR